MYVKCIDVFFVRCIYALVDSCKKVSWDLWKVLCTIENRCWMDSSPSQTSSIFNSNVLFWSDYEWGTKTTYLNQQQVYVGYQLPFQGLRTLRRNGAAKVAAQRALANRSMGGQEMAEGAMVTERCFGGTRMSQEVSTWLVNGLQPTYKIL